MRRLKKLVAVTLSIVMACSGNVVYAAEGGGVNDTETVTVQEIFTETETEEETFTETETITEEETFTETETITEKETFTGTEIITETESIAETAFLTESDVTQTDDGLDTYDGEKSTEQTRYTIELSETYVSMYVGESHQLTANVTPDAKIKWSSEDESVAKVTSAGRIKAIKRGSTYITATVGDYSISCYVDVEAPSLYMSEYKTIYVGDTDYINYTVEPTVDLKWTSSNTKVVKVDQNGKITGVGKGKAIIIAKGKGCKGKCAVYVEKPDIYIANKTINLYEGSVAHFDATVTPDYLAKKYKSSNTSVVKVNKNGMMTAVKAGTAYVTISVKGYSKKIRVNVYKSNYKISITKKTIMKGNSFTIHIDNGSDSYIYPNVDSYSSDKLSYSYSSDNKGVTYTIKAINKGSAYFTVYMYRTENGKSVLWNRTVKINVVNEGIPQQDFSIAKGTKKQLTLRNVGKSSEISRIKWKSSNPNKVVVNSKGLVKGKSAGKVKVTAFVTLKDGTEKKYSTSFKVSNPRINKKLIYMSPANVWSSGKSYGQIKVKGLNRYSNVKFKSNHSSIASVDRNGNITAGKVGTAVISVTVDGKTMRCKVIVSNPRLKEYSARLAPSNQWTIPLAGVKSSAKKTFSTRNGGVASVDGTGTVTAVGYGSTYIDIKVNGVKLSCLIEVAPQRAINACIKGEEIYATCTYSQENRMSDGYYDCSALVFKSYDRDADLLGGSYSWAPTAANMAKHMENTGKVLSYGAIDVSQMRPGDLIFYGGSDNGRFLGIYHVEMYYGGGAYATGNAVMVARPLNE